MSRIAIIGAGVSGLTCGQLLKEEHEVTVFERDSLPGGLIKCRRVNGNLFHTCGGHIFNSKRKDVLDWFWSKFDREGEFTKADRNSVVIFDNGKEIPYPIENHMYLFEEDVQKKFIDDLLFITRLEGSDPRNFEEFLRNRFGETLYRMYFQPYNEKVWRRDLNNVPLSWLEGKLPMPTVSEMIYNNINHVKEKSFVHATFWYEKMNGSQYLADRLAEGLKIKYNSVISSIKKKNNKWIVDDQEFDMVIYCGNVKEMMKTINGVDLRGFQDGIDSLEYHGTTAVFCEIDKNPYSWIYQPSRNHESHRIICTGNFAESNNEGLPEGRITATIEFTDVISKESILDNLARIPLNPKYIDHKYNQYTYPIQDSNTRIMIKLLKKKLAPENFFFTGRFADWEYYNMDAAMGAAMDMIGILVRTKERI